MSAPCVPVSIFDTKATTQCEKQVNSVYEIIVTTKTGMHVARVNLTIASISYVQNEAGHYQYTALTSQVMIQHQHNLSTTADQHIQSNRRRKTKSFGPSYQDPSLWEVEGESGIGLYVPFELQSNFARGKDMPSSSAAEADLEQDFQAHTGYLTAQESGRFFEVVYLDLAFIGAQFDVTSEVVVETETLGWK